MPLKTGAEQDRGLVMSDAVSIYQHHCRDL